MDKDGPDRRAGLPDGRAAPGPGQRGARGGRARRPGAVPGGRRASRREAGRPRPPTREIDLLTVARHPAPARLRPRRARGARARCSASRTGCSPSSAARARGRRRTTVSVPVDWLADPVAVAGRRWPALFSARRRRAVRRFSRARAEELADRGPPRRGAGCSCSLDDPRALPQHRAAAAPALRDRRDRHGHGRGRPDARRRRAVRATAGWSLIAVGDARWSSPSS